MIRVWLFSFVLLLATGFKSYGQIAPSYDTNYVKENYDKLCVTLIAENTNCELVVSNEKTTQEDLSYVTNSRTAYGFGLDYKWLTFSYSYAFKNLDESLYDGGFTEVKSISAGITSNRFWCRAAYQTQKGMYLDNINVFPQKDAITQKREDIRGSVLFGTFNYIFNHKRYSHNASLWQIDQQLKSAGTFTVGLAAAIYTTEADSSLIPSVLKSSFNAENNISSSQTHSYALTGGYMHTFVIARRIFIHLGVIPGICLQKNSATISSGGELTSNLEWGAYTEGRFAIGYNGKKYYGGVSGVTYVFTEDNFDAALEHSYTFTRLFFGMRLPLKVKIPFDRYL